jgi:protein-S-isoprenylcysteine O-methyltransferase Ste14
VSFDARIYAFLFATAILAWVSRRSLLRPRSHGFYRFFAWEAILGLILLNLSAWFTDWLSWHQIVSWVLLFASLIPLALGVWALRTRGMPEAASRHAPDLLAFERTTRLVSAGIYRHIRHPLYCSLLLLGWGVFLKQPGVPEVPLVAAATVLLFITARRDEAECLQQFGSDYRHYMRRTRMFIPLVF